MPRSTIATIPLSNTVTLATIYGVCEGFQITLQEFFASPQYQLFRVSDGFGCIPDGIGRACYGRFCIDGERTMWPKGDFLGVANERVERIAEEMETAWKDRTVEKNMEM